MQLTVHWSRLARLSAYALLALVAFLAVLQLFLPVSLVAVFYDICEMIEDWQNVDNYPNRHTYKYPYNPHYPSPRLATAQERAAYTYPPRNKGEPLFRHQLIDEACPRFVTFELCAACGIGHKATEYLFGIRLANLMNATYVMDYAAWRYTKHGNLEWADRMLGIVSGEVDLNDVRRKYWLRIVRPCPIDQREPPMDRGCHVLYSAPRYPGCCKTTASYGSLTCQWSPFSFQILPDHAKMLRAKYAAAAPTRDFSVVDRYFTRDTISVAWHIRIGDWNPHEGDQTHYRRVAETLAAAFDGLPVVYYFFSYYDPTRGDTPPPGFEFLSELGLGRVRYVADTDTEATHALMIAADVLVGSGSGMLTLPAVYSDGLIIYHERMRFPDMMDEMPHWVRLYSDGTMDADPAALRARLTKSLCANARAKDIPVVKCSDQ